MDANPRDEHSTRYDVSSPALLPAACLAFTAGPDIRANAATIEHAIAEAHQAGIRLLLTPEAALTGYPGVARSCLEEVDWPAVASLEDALAEQALERGICLILGSGSLSDGHVTNDALVCGAVATETRYRKRCLTPGDLDHYQPGLEPAVVNFAGWRLGVTICFDVRFGDVWTDLLLARCDLFCCLAHMGGPTIEADIKKTVIACHYASRAAEAATPLLLCNTGADDRWLDSGLWDPRGIRVDGTGRGLFTCTVRPRQAFHPWYGALRRQAMTRWRTSPHNALRGC